MPRVTSARVSVAFWPVLHTHSSRHWVLLTRPSVRHLLCACPEPGLRESWLSRAPQGRRLASGWVGLAGHELWLCLPWSPPCEEKAAGQRSPAMQPRALPGTEGDGEVCMDRSGWGLCFIFWPLLTVRLRDASLGHFPVGGKSAQVICCEAEAKIHRWGSQRTWAVSSFASVSQDCGCPPHLQVGSMMLPVPFIVWPYLQSMMYVSTVGWNV